MVVEVGWPERPDPAVYASFLSLTTAILCHCQQPIHVLQHVFYFLIWLSIITVNWTISCCQQVIALDMHIQAIHKFLSLWLAWSCLAAFLPFICLFGFNSAVILRFLHWQPCPFSNRLRSVQTTGQFLITLSPKSLQENLSIWKTCWLKTFLPMSPNRNSGLMASCFVGHTQEA